MWPFTKEPSKASAQAHKKVTVNGQRFVIRKLNPLMDFEGDQMPQIFTAHLARRKKTEPEPAPSTKEQERALRDMQAVVRAGLVEPELVPVGQGEQKGHEAGLTIEDIFRDGSLGVGLYWEILAHSLNRYKGLRGALFLARTRRELYSAWRRAMESAPVPSPSETVTSA